MLNFLMAAPWLLFPVFVIVLLRRRPRITDYEPAYGELPLVSIIVPARNEAINIGHCLSSLVTSSYPHREIIVVDDDSTDSTGDIARAFAEREPGQITVVNNDPLPEGWVGKSWACWTGYQRSRGELLLFTDADTRHGEDLLAHAVGAQNRTSAGLVSLLPRQRMESFWERVILPHIFLAIMIRFPNSGRVSRTRNPRSVIANGQFMLLPRGTYEAIGGHRAVRGYVVEDLAIAQAVVRSGQRMLLAHAYDVMDTRMYRSLREIIEGWTKNIALGAQLTLPPGIGILALWLGVLAGVVLWVVPPIVLAAGFLVGALARFREWALIATLASLVGWLYTHLRMGAGVRAVLLYPLGALLSSFVVARSAIRGNRVEWRGRRYRV
ncbi:MAG: glycosyltransferase family 2 protein [Gemmatimonadota bacterium]